MNFMPWDKWIKKPSDKVLFFFSGREKRHEHEIWRDEFFKHFLHLSPLLLSCFGLIFSTQSEAIIKIPRKNNEREWQEREHKNHRQFSWGQNKTETFVSATVPTLFLHHLSKNAEKTQRKIGQISTRIDENFFTWNSDRNFAEFFVRKEKRQFIAAYLSVIPSLTHRQTNNFIQIFLRLSWRKMWKVVPKLFSSPCK